MYFLGVAFVGIVGPGGVYVGMCKKKVLPDRHVFKIQVRNILGLTILVHLGTLFLLNVVINFISLILLRIK